MIHYKDRTFCNAGVLCRDWECTRRIQPSDMVEARRLGLPISMMDFTTAKCFVPFFSPSERAANYMALKDVGDVHDVSPVCHKKTRKYVTRTPTGKKTTGKAMKRTARKAKRRTC